ncbi:hypothetical protein PIB30_060572 [Stylosanthes scabra]|uniref:Peptidase A2 domain-containing protein n=1 Tax=Stylosanthes scabra TaxID=79078 RepID=A0ABU6WLS3_9FABA|nr:hypothetical protein [Stylosanthes scabra]
MAPRVNAQPHNLRDNQRDSGFKGQPKPLKQKFNNYTPSVAPITEIYQQILEKGYGHKTQDCYDLKDAIEQAIRDGKWSTFVKIILEPRSSDRERSPKAETRNPINQRDENEESTTMVNVITGSSAVEKSKSALKKNLKILAHMIISAKLRSGLVRRILVDTGADSNIIFKNTLDALGFKNGDMETHQPGVMGLGDHFIKTDGSIDLSATIGSGNTRRPLWPNSLF